MNIPVLAWLIAFSILPAVAVLVWLRNAEHRGREGWVGLAQRFAFGATAGVALALLFSVIFDVGLEIYGNKAALASTFVAVVFIAPFTEELAKALGLPGARKHIRELEDGLIYGAAIGLGFAATENLVYGIDAMVRHDADVAYWTIAVRSLSSMLVHAGASAIIGFGYGLAVLRGQVYLRVIPHYLVAVALHAGYNFIASRGDALGLVVAVIAGLVIATQLRRQIVALDALPHLLAKSS